MVSNKKPRRKSGLLTLDRLAKLFPGILDLGGRMKRKKYVISLFLLVLSTTAIYGAEQKIAVPSYFYPGSLWDKLESGYPTVQIGIINPNSGAGSSSNPDYAQQVQSSQQLGMTIIGYVYTSYGRRSLSTVKNDIDKYYNWYNVDGIFIDETSISCGAISYYSNLYGYTLYATKLRTSDIVDKYGLLILRRYSAIESRAVEAHVVCP